MQSFINTFRPEVEPLWDCQPVPSSADRGTKQTVSPAHTRMHVRERAYTRYVYIYVCVYACEYNSLVNHVFVCACVYFDTISNRKTLYDLKILILSI